MLRAVALLLPLLSLTCGCKALVRDAETVEYRPGPTLSTTVADCDAEYRLSEKGQTRLPVDVVKGERVGFRREPDGSLVAVAGKTTTPISAGEHYVWLCTPKPVTGWDRFAVKTRDKCEETRDKCEEIGVTVLISLLIIMHPELAGQL